MGMKIRNLVLDMGNVLLTWAPEAFALRAAGNEADAGILCGALFGAPEWQMQDAGLLTEEVAYHVARSRTPERLHGALQLLYERWPLWMEPLPGADETTARAKRAGLKLYLLSNAGTRFPAAISHHGFIARFDGMMVSAHEKVSKPDPRIYRRLFDTFSLSSRECLFVDDIRQNIDAAEQAGMEAHLFDGDFRKVEERLRHLGVPLP